MKRSAVVFIVAMILCSVFLFHNGPSSVAAKDPVSYELVYTSVEVQPGDSLWTISGRYMEHSGLSQRDYIEQVRFLNHLYEDTLYPGAHLVIPVAAEAL